MSHDIEQAAMAIADGSLVLLALFQRPLYFDRERVAYRRLARAARLTVVGVVDELPDVPGVEGVAIDPDEPLAGERSVIMLTSRAGAALVALDQEQVVPGETSVETGRSFSGWSSLHRVDARAQVERLRSQLGDRLSRRAARPVARPCRAGDRSGSAPD